MTRAPTVTASRDPARPPRVGLALGSGAARGWAHIGVIRALERAGIRPDLICGTSIGALVGAAFASGQLDGFERWVRGLTVREVVAQMDVSLGSGLLKGDRLMEFIRHNFADRPIAELTTPFAAVATSLATGAEVWLRDGSTIDAVRASLALPGILTPVRRDGAVLVDGGLVNPVPVSLARAMGAEVVIAVDLSSDMVRHHSSRSTLESELPSMLDVLGASLNIMQVRITRSRMAGDPPDLIVAPRLAQLGLFEFHRAAEAIEEGTRAVERVAHALPGAG